MTGRPRVAVLDYGSGNVHSAVQALDAAGASVSLTRDGDEVYEADGLFVPGVGAFAAVIAQLRAIGGAELIDRRLADARPVLGICVGMQVMFSAGIERGVTSSGLARWPGTVRRLEADVVPHTGWTQVAPEGASTLLAGIEHERFYFVHSYAATEWTGGAATCTWATHGQRFIAAVEDGPLAATQFHPEKSGPAGIRLLTNWLGSL